MPFLGGVEGGSSNPPVPPSVIGDGAPGTGSTEDNGYFYVDRQTGIVYVNVNGTYQPTMNEGDQGPIGPSGQPRFSGNGAPDQSVLTDAVPGDVYLDVTTGDVYRLFNDNQPSVSYGTYWK